MFTSLSHPSLNVADMIFLLGVSFLVICLFLLQKFLQKCLHILLRVLTDLDLNSTIHLHNTLSYHLDYTDFTPGLFQGTTTKIAKIPTLTSPYSTEIQPKVSTVKLYTVKVDTANTGKSRYRKSKYCKGE